LLAAPVVTIINVRKTSLKNILKIQIMILVISWKHAFEITTFDFFYPNFILL